MLSNKYRPLKIFVTLIIMIILVWWGLNKAYEHEITFPEAIADLETYAGEELYFAGRIIENTNNKIILKDRSMKVYLSYDESCNLADIPVGKVISGHGPLMADGTIHVEDYHYHYFRWVKVWLSLFITTGMFIMFWIKYRWDSKRWVFIEKFKVAHPRL